MTNNFYSCRFTRQQQHFLIEIKLTGEPINDSIANRNARIRQVLEKALQAGLLTNNNYLEIACKQNTLYCPINPKVTSEPVEGDIIPQTIDALTITCLSTTPLPKRARTFAEIKTDLLTLWPASYPLLAFFWHLAVYPLALLASALHPGEVYDYSSLQLKEDPNNRLILEDAMQEVVDLLHGDEEMSQAPITTQFNKGLAWARRWRDALLSFEQKKQLIEEITTTVTAQDTAPLTTLTVLPGGYWNGNDSNGKNAFEPLLWSFHRDAQGALLLSTWSYGMQKEQKQIRSFSFGQQPNKAEIGQLVALLLMLAARPKELHNVLSGELLGTTYLQLLKRAFSPIEIAAGTDNMTLPSSNLLMQKELVQFIESLCHSPAGTPLKDEEIHPTGRFFVRKDPIKLVHEMLRQQFPEAPLKDKALFTLHLLHNRLHKVIQALPNMADIERKRWLLKVQKQAASLHRQLDKQGVVAAGDITHVFHALQRDIVQLEQETSQAVREKTTHFNPVEPTPYNLRVNVAKQEEQKADGKEQGRLTSMDYAQLRALRTAITAVSVGNNSIENTTQIAQSLSILTERMNSLVAGRHYPAALSLYRLIMPHLPGPPNSDRHDIHTCFWSELKAIPDHKSTADQSHLIADQLGKLSQYFWEAKIRTADPRLHPDEWIYMLNTEAAMCELMNIRLAALTQMQKNGVTLTFEEECFAAIACVYKNNQGYRGANLADLSNEEYLRPWEHPHLNKKYEKIKNYLTKLNQYGGRDDISTAIFSKRYNELSHCTIILQTAQQRHIDVGKLSSDDLWAAYLHRGWSRGEITIPSQLSDLSRHQLMYTALLFPETSIARYVVTPRGLIQAGIRAGARIVGSDMDTKAEQRKLFLHALQILDGYERLEVATMCHMSMFGIVCNYGIVAQGTKPGAVLTVAMTPGGITDMQQLMGGRQDTGFQDRLGYPAESGIESFFDAQFYRGLLNEPQRLRLCLTNSSTNPLEIFLLHTIKGHQSGRDATYQSAYEVIDLILQRPWLIDQLYSDAKGRESFEVQKRFYEVLFAPAVLQEAIFKAPEFFASHSAPLLALLQRCHEENKTTQYLFLLYLVQTVYAHLQLRRVPEAASWPNIHAHPELLRNALDAWEGGKNLQVKIDGAAYIISLFANDPNCLHPEAIELLRSPAIVARLLLLGSWLEATQEQATIPIVGIQAARWMQEQLAPHLNGMEPRLLTPYLDAWVELQTGVRGQGQWARVDTPMVWQRTNGMVVDLASFHVVNSKRTIEGIYSVLPSDIAYHRDYKQLFGDKTFPAHVTTMAAPGVFLYSFIDAEQNSYRVTLTRPDGAVAIERLIDIDPASDQKQWHQYRHPERIKAQQAPLTAENEALRQANRIARWIPGMQEAPVSATPEAPSDFSALERQIIEAGVWIDPAHPRRAIAFLRATAMPSQEPGLRIHLAFDMQGGLSSAQLPEGTELVHDKKGGGLLRCLPGGQQLFLRQPGGHEITEVRFLGQKIALKRPAAGAPWRLCGDDALEGACLLVAPAACNAAASTLLRPLAEAFDHTGLAVGKEGQTTLLIWPHRARTYGDAAHPIIEFEKEIQLIPPVKITVSDDGIVATSCTGYLQLAYLFAVKHEYAKAAAYIEIARTTERVRTEEMDLLFTIEANFSSIPLSSARSALIRLKAFLAVRRIVQEQTAIAQYSPPEWQAFLTASSSVYEAYTAYGALVQHSPFGMYKEHFFHSDELDVSPFSAEELLELRCCQREAMAFMLSKQKPPTAEQLQLYLPTASTQEVELVLPFFIQAMAPPIKDPKHLLANLNLSEDIVSHFFEIYNWIVKFKLEPKHLQQLFGPIPSAQALDMAHTKEQWNATGNNPIEGSEELLLYGKIVKIDIARRLLLAAAAANVQGQEELPTPFDLADIAKMQSAIPSSMLSALWKGALANIKLGWALLHTTDREQYLSTSSERRLLEKIQQLAEKIPHSAEAIGLHGFVPAQQDDKELAKQMLLQGKTVDIQSLQQAIVKDSMLFGPLITPIVQELLGQEKLKSQMAAANGLMPIDAFIELIEAQSGINLLELVREQQVRERIAILEQASTKKTPGPCPEVDMQVHLDRDLLPTPEKTLLHSSNTIWVIPPLAQQLDNLTAMEEQFTKALGEAEDKRLLAGVKAAKTTLKKQIQNKCSVNKNSLNIIIKEVHYQKNACEKKLVNTKTALIAHLQANFSNPKLPREVRRALKHKSINEEELINLLKQPYQTLMLEDGTACQLLTQLLLEQAAHKVFSTHVEEQLEILTSLQQQGIDSTACDWISAATKVRSLTNQALNFSRYLNEQGYLKQPRLFRKILVTEAHQGIIVTQQQIALIEKMAATPSDWYELKVGGGKTSVIFPIVLMLLIEQGKFPVAMVKEELLQQHFDALDRSTRSLLARAALQFSFRINDPLTPLIAQEQYYRLLQAEAHQGYPVTTVSSVIAIDQKLQLLNKELNKLLKDPQQQIVALLSGQAQQLSDIEATKKSLQPLVEVDSLQKQMYYLGKIRDKLNLILIDEVDDVQRVINENNVGFGDPVDLNIDLQNTMKHMMLIMAMSTDPIVQLLWQAIEQGQQAALEIPWIKQTAIPALVRAMVDNPDYQSYVGDTSGFDGEGLIAYLCTVFEGKEPLHPELPATVAQKLGALKKIVQKSLPVALHQNPGIEVGVKESDGYQVGPKVRGKEKIDSTLRDECDLIVNHYLAYGVRLPQRQLHQKEGEGFVARALDVLRTSKKEIYQKWVDEAGGEELITYLNRPKNMAQRLDFLRLQIIDEKRIKQYYRGIRFNVQDISYDRPIGGMTGTLNRNALPQISGRVPEQETAKELMGQVLLEAGLLQLPIVMPLPSEASEELLATMSACARQAENKVLINQGFDLLEGDAKAVVAAVRQAAPDRIYAYVDSDTREFYLWKRGAADPERIGKKKLDALALHEEFRNYGCFYLGPLDLIGTDCKIPPGRGVAFISSKCSESEFIQLLGRLRQAGDTQGMDFFISAGICKRLQMAGGKLTYAALVQDICRQGVEQEQGENLQTAIEAMQRIATMGTRQLLYSCKGINDADYWNATSPIFRVLHGYTVAQLSQLAMDPNSGWLEKKRDISLGDDFVPSMRLPTTQQADAIYEQEKAKIVRLEEGANALLQQGLFLSQLFDAKTRDALTTRLKGFVVSIQKMELDLNTTHKSFVGKLKDARDNSCPKTMVSDGSSLPQPHAQVQQVQVGQQTKVQQVQTQQIQQQQQAQQQQQIHPLDPDQESILVHEFVPISVSTSPDLTRITQREWYSFSQLVSIFFLCMELRCQFHISKNFLELFMLLNGIRGRLSFCRILIKGDLVCLITKNDYHHKITSDHFDAIYSITSPSICGQSLVLDQGIDQQISPEVLKKIVQAKWFLGISEYTNEETIVLTNWLQDEHKSWSQPDRHHTPKEFAQGAYHVIDETLRPGLDMSENGRNEMADRQLEQFIERFGTEEQMALAKKLLVSN